MILLITVLQDFCHGISVKRQVAKEVRKSITDLEDRLMQSIKDTCHKQACTSGRSRALFNITRAKWLLKLSQF